MASGDIKYLQRLIDSENRLSADYLQSGSSNVAVSDSEKTYWDNKQEQLSAGTGINISGTNIAVKYGDQSGFTTDEYGLKIWAGDGLTLEGAGELRVQFDGDTIDADLTTGKLKANYKDYYKAGTNISITNGTISNDYTFDYEGREGIVIDNSAKTISISIGNGLLYYDNGLQVMAGDTMDASQGPLDVKYDDDTIKSDPDHAYRLKACYKEYYKAGDNIVIDSDGTISAGATAGVTYAKPLTKEGTEVSLIISDGLKKSDTDDGLTVNCGDTTTTESGVLEVRYGTTSGITADTDGIKVNIDDYTLQWGSTRDKLEVHNVILTDDTLGGEYILKLDNGVLSVIPL